MQHLWNQPNSVDDMEDARRKYLHNKIFKAIVPHFVDSKYDHGPFKLIATISGLETISHSWVWKAGAGEPGLLLCIQQELC